MPSIPQLDTQSLLTPWLRNLDSLEDAIAIEAGNHFVTHRELFEAAWAVRGIVDEQSQCASSNPVVALVGDKSITTVSAILGILLSGHAYSYIDPSVPPLSVPALLKALNPAAVMWIGPGQVARRDLFEQHTRRLDLPWAVVTPYSIGRGSAPPRGTDCIPEPASETVAYVMFSSGSTGIPKGVCVSHRAVVAAVGAFVRDVGPSPLDIVGANVSFGFDVSVFDIFSSLWSGARLNLICSPTSSTLRETGERIAKSGASILFTVPSLASAMVRAPAWGASKRDLRVLSLTGERFTASLHRELRQRLSAGVHIWNLYGGTEMPYVLANRVDPKQDVDPGEFPWCEKDVRLGLNGDFSIQPDDVGREGELCVTGHPVMSGYLTDETGWPRTEPLQSHLATGDVFRIVPGRKVVLVGRMDRQVRIHGYRVDLDMVSAWAQRACPFHTCIALLDPDGERIHVAVEGEPGSIGTEWKESLMAHCRGGLPTHMVPSQIHVLNGMPRTRTGKPDPSRILEVILSSSPS